MSKKFLGKLIVSCFFTFIPPVVTLGVFENKESFENISNIDFQDNDVDDSSDLCDIALLCEIMDNKPKKILSKCRINNSKLTISTSTKKDHKYFGQGTIFSKIISNIPKDSKASIKLMLTLGKNGSSVEKIDENFDISKPKSDERVTTTPRTDFTSTNPQKRRIEVLNKIRRYLDKCKCESMLRFPHTVSIRRIYILLKFLSKIDINMDELSDDTSRRLNCITLIRKNTKYKNSDNADKFKLGDLLGSLWNEGESLGYYEGILDNLEMYNVVIN